MNISFRFRRKRTIAGAVLALALGGAAAAFGTGSASAAVGNAVVTDSLTGTLTGTATDAIVTCAPSQIAIGGTEAEAIRVACLTEYNGEWVKVSWTGSSGVATKLTEQTDGNFVLYASNGKVWGGGTRFADNANGPGCLAQFQGDANLIVRNCGGTAIFASNTHTYPNAVLAFQADGNLVIYATSAGTSLWSTKTN